MGNTLYVANVTSQEWMDTSQVSGINGALWTHLVYVVVPKEMKQSTTAFAHIYYGENLEPNNIADPFENTGAAWEIDMVAHYSGSIAIGMHHIPNAPIVFMDDPDFTLRYEDEIVAWGWKKYLNEPEHDPRWLLRLPMVKSAFQCMRAAQEALSENQIANIEGWVLAGVSKRGWTTWDVAATNCPTCVKIVGIIPQVPVVPELTKEAHFMWQSLGGFTWAFLEYMDQGVLQQTDTPEWQTMMDIVDPIKKLNFNYKIKQIYKLY